ncbi:hypothetical protein MMC07_009911 [Pseudocyphellaria aurata]|nr:hypothetical protein [Pseudocyphellaria aurata]
MGRQRRVLPPGWPWKPVQTGYRGYAVCISSSVPENACLREREYHETFAARLDKAFYGLAFDQRIRRSMYREAAKDSPPGHTPPESRDGDEEGHGATPDDKARPAAEQASRTQPGCKKHTPAAICEQSLTDATGDEAPVYPKQDPRPSLHYHAPGLVSGSGPRAAFLLNRAAVNGAPLSNPRKDYRRCVREAGGKVMFVW